MTNHPAPGERIIVLGTSGSGKTTLARQLAERLGCPHTEMDALYWEPNWTEASTEVFRERVRQAASAERWVMDGNYGKVRDIAWAAADTLVWLDYSLPLILWRLLGRSLRRSLGGEVLWNGNRETLANQFLSRDSILLWALQTYKRRQRDFPRLFARPEYAHLKVIHLRSPGETARWLGALPGSGTRGLG